jgi:hypothetical protein
MYQFTDLALAPVFFFSFFGEGLSFSLKKFDYWETSQVSG